MILTIMTGMGCMVVKDWAHHGLPIIIHIYIMAGLMMMMMMMIGG